MKNTAWELPETEKDKQSITNDWKPAHQKLIEGVVVTEVKNVMKSNGYLTEIYRREWESEGLPIDQVFQIMMQPGGISAWHVHQFTTDRLFANQGTLKIVLYDGREDSPTYGQIDEFRCGALRPMLIMVPPKVWHGVQNYTHEPALLLNMVDQAYQYEDPDHWRVSEDTSAIPYSFS